ncbi:hypothetical protein GCM10023079_37770 [Streptomyces chitinivorans]
MVGKHGEFGGVAAEALHLVHGEGDPAVRVRDLDFDLAGRPQRFLEPGAGPYADADLFTEDLDPRDAVPAERVELGGDLCCEVPPVRPSPYG